MSGLRNNHRKTVTITMVVLLIVLLFVSACGDRTVQQMQTKKNTKKTTISWWAFPNFTQVNAEDAGGTYEQSLIEAFEAENPDIEVELKMLNFSSGPDKINVAIANNSMGDVLFDAPGRIISYGKDGLLVNLNDLFTEEFEEDVNNQTILNACKAKEVPYMYPLSAAPFYMVFNKEYLEQAGVSELVKEGWTTDDFTTVMEALRANGYASGSLFCKDAGGDQATRAFLANLYDSTVTDEGLTQYTLNDENGRKAFAYVYDLYQRGLLLDGTMYNGTEDLKKFTTGKTSMSLLWSPGLQASNSAALKANGIETVEVPFPSPEGVPKLEYLINGFCIFEHGDEARTEASGKFVKFLCDDAVYGPKDVIQTGSFPVRQSFGELYEDERMKRIGSWNQYYGVYYNTIDGFEDMRKIWSSTLQQMTYGNLTPEQAADRFVSLSNDTIGK